VVKAAVIFNFIKFVEWPDDSLPVERIRLCLVGDNESLQNAFSRIEGKDIQGRSLEVRYQRRRAPAGCQVVVISNIDGHPADLLRALGEAPVLTIGDTDDFVDSGGMIELVSAGSRVQFGVNADAAHKARLKISAQLLKLAQRVLSR
jgi:hypothetical protein